MIELFDGVQVVRSTTATDMRRGFDRLSRLTQSLLQKDPMPGHLFVFRNSNGNT